MARRVPWRRLRAFLTVITVVAASVVVPASTAGAVVPPVPPWTLGDGFESNPAATWFFGGSPACQFCGSFVPDESFAAHSGNAFAEIESDAPGSFFSVGRNVHLVMPKTTVTTCKAQVWTRLGGGQLNFEVIDPRTWTYIALTSELPPQDDGLYRKIMIGPWTPKTFDVVIRVSVVRSTTLPVPAFTNVDDLLVICG